MTSQKRKRLPADKLVHYRGHPQKRKAHSPVVFLQIITLPKLVNTDSRQNFFFSK